MKIIKRTTQFIKNVYYMGKLGVGTDNPTAQVEVNGNMRVRAITNDNALTKIVVIDADGNVKSRELSGMAPTDKFIQSSSYDPITNNLNITMTSGVEFNIDLSDLQDEVDTKLIDADQDTFVEVEQGSDDDTVRFTAAGVEVMKMNSSLVTANEHSNWSAGASFPVRSIGGNQLVLEEDHTLKIEAGTQDVGVTTLFINSDGIPEGITTDGSVALAIGDVVTLSTTAVFPPFDYIKTIVATAGTNEYLFVSSLSPGGYIDTDGNKHGHIPTLAECILPEPTNIIDGKIFELLASADSVLTSDGGSYIQGFGNTFDFTAQQTSYIKVQADLATNSYVLVEQGRTFGDLIDTTAPISGLTFVDPKLVGLTAGEVDVWRDGSLEMPTEYTLNPVTGTLTVVDAFQEETLKIRLT